jgi:hypothetical protein
MTQTNFAKEIKREKSYVTQLKSAGRLIMKNKLVDVEASLKLISETADPARQDVGERHQQERDASASLSASDAGTEQSRRAVMDELTGKAGITYQQSRAMKEKYFAMRAKIAYKKEVGLLLEASEVHFAIADGDAIIRNRLESLPDLLAPQLAALNDEQKIRQLLRDHIEQLLSELSRTFNGMVQA